MWAYRTASKDMCMTEYYEGACRTEYNGGVTPRGIVLILVKARGRDKVGGVWSVI